MPKAGSLILLQFCDRNRLVQQCFDLAVEKLMQGVTQPSSPKSLLSHLPHYSYSTLDHYLRRQYLPEHLSPVGRGLLEIFLGVPDNWQTLLDMVPELENRKDRIALIGATAYIEVWWRLNTATPASHAH
jgi:hypothetical protein